MKLKKALLFNVAIAIAVASVVFLSSHIAIVKRLEYASLDFFFRLRGNRPSPSNIIIIEITDSELSKIGRWPWDRSWHAALARKLTQLGAKSIFFDFVFSEPSDEKNDMLLEEAIQQNKNIYLPFVFQDETYDIQNALLPLKRFSAHAKGTGAINIYPDLDGILRTSRLIFQASDRTYSSAALKIAMDYAGLELKESTPTSIVLAGLNRKIKIPLIKKNEMLINWIGAWRKTFTHYSFLDVLNRNDDRINNFKGSICIIGLTAVGLYDIKPIPIEPEYPGLGVIANTISNILNNDFLKPVPNSLNILILYLICIIPAFFLRGARPLKEILFTLLLFFSYASLAFILFKHNLVINPVLPLVGLSTTYALVGSTNYLRIAQERQRLFKLSITDGLTDLYNIRYFKMVLETEIMLSKYDPQSKFCLVMVDIDHFKAFNDSFGHQEGDRVLKGVAVTLKSSVRSSDIVARYGGEEMIILLRGSTLKDGLIVGEKMRRNIENLSVREIKNSYKLTASLGIVSFKKSDDVENIIKRADVGLYKAKESGRNRVCTVEEVANP